MFTDYQEDVFRDYLAKKDAGTLSDNLLKGTIAKLKAECADVCAKRYLRQDERALSRYFKKQTDQQGYLDVINGRIPDDYKSVYKFLKGQTKRPGEDIVELLAWLIDYQPRPYLRWAGERSENEVGKIIVEGDEKEVVELENKIEIDEPEKKIEEEELGKITINVTGPKQAKKKGMTALITILVSVTFAAVLIVWPRTKPAGPVPPKQTTVKKNSETCMLWKDDHYEVSPCIAGGVPLDSNRLLHLRKLKGSDKVAESDIGHLWYFKLNGKLELFTAVGPYPLDTNRRLLPLTPYMYNKYLRHGDQTDDAQIR